MKWRVVVLLLVVCSLHVGALELDLEYITPGENDYYLYGHSNVGQKTKEPPPGDWTLPDLEGKAPVYGLVSLGDQDYLLILSKSKKRKEFYDVCYFDLNGNGDLTEGEQLELKYSGGSDGRFYHTDFSTIDMEIPVDGVQKPIRISLNVYCHRSDKENDFYAEQNWRNLHIGIRSQFGYRAEMEIDSKTYRFDIADTNCNGRVDDFLTEVMAFNDPEQYYAMGDRVFITEGEKADYYDACVLSNYLLLGGTVYEVAVDCKASKLHLTPTETALHPVTLAAEAERMLLFDEKTQQSLVLYKPGRAVKVPAGAYKLINYQMIRETKKKDQWELIANGTPDAPTLKVGADDAPMLVFGEPYTPQAGINKWARENFPDNPTDSIDINFTIFGAGKELVSSLRRTAGSSSTVAMSSESRDLPKEPTYKILAPDGEMVAQGSFEYG